MPIRYLVAHRAGEWHIVDADMLSTPYPGQGVALDAAVDMAELAGKSGHKAEVAVEDPDGETRTIWRSGDPYPLPR